MTTQADRTKAWRFFYDLPTALLASWVVVGWLAPGLAVRYAGWPLVISLFFAGMPHGAVDFLLNARLKSVSRLGDQLQAFLWYVVTLTIGVITFIFFPRMTLVVFAITSAQHFGWADARVLEKRFQTSVPVMVRRCSAIARGVAILALPFVFAPSESVEVINAVLRFVSTPLIEPAAEAVTYIATACVIVAAAALLVSTTYRVATGQIRVALVELLETAVIGAAFGTLHPMFAMGLYVMTWHSWRHLYAIAPFLGVEPRSSRLDELLRCLWRLHVAALPLLIPTLVLYGLVAWWKIAVWDSFQLAALAIATFIVVTLPHHLLIEKIFATSRDRQGQATNQKPGQRTSESSPIGKHMSHG